MTQQYMGQIPDPSQESGNDLADRLNGFDNGHRTNQSGSTRPAGILAGGIWTRVAGGVYDLMLFDGTQDRVVMRGDRNLAGLTDVEAARTNLGLSGLAVKDKAAIAADTTGTLPVDRGGTGATDAGGARTALGLTYATKAEAETGTANNRVMTPLRTAQAIAELAEGGLPAVSAGDVFSQWFWSGTNNMTQGTADISIKKVAVSGGSFRLKGEWRSSGGATTVRMRLRVNGTSVWTASGPQSAWQNVSVDVPIALGDEIELVCSTPGNTNTEFRNLHVGLSEPGIGLVPDVYVR